MPFYRITLIQGAYGAVDTILAAVSRGNAAAGYPPNDVFQRVEELPRSHLVIDARYPDLPRDRTDRLMIFDVLTSNETSPEQRLRIRTEIIRSLDETGVDTNDVIMFFTDYDRAATSFSGGKSPPPIHYAS